VEEIVGKAPSWLPHYRTGPKSHKIGKSRGDHSGGLFLFVFNILNKEVLLVITNFNLLLSEMEKRKKYEVAN